MKKLLSIFFILISILSNAQDISPLPFVTVKKLIAPNTPVFYYNTVDSAFWVFKGETGWLRIATNLQLQRYYVPYKYANRPVELGDQRISSTKQRLPLFNGACAVPTILDNGDGSITVGDGEYHLSTNVEGKGTERFVISGSTYTLTDNTMNYLVADYNSGTPIVKVILDVNLINETTVIPIFSVFRSGTALHSQNWDSLGLALANKVHQSIVKTQRYRRESGLGISEFPTRYLSIGNGKVWVGAVPVTIDAVTTNTDNLRLYYHSGGVWTLSLQTQYNNTQYDNGTDLVTLTANRYAVNWLFRGVESQKHLYVVLGRGDYTLAQAQEAVLPAIPAIISSHAVLIGKLIVQRDATTATSIQSAFDVQFTAATPNAHNDLIGRDVSDVHPAGSITFTPTGTYTATTVADALAQIDYKTPDRSTTNEIQAPTRVGDIIGLTQTTTTISIADKLPSANVNGTLGYLSIFTGSNSLGNSIISRSDNELRIIGSDSFDPSINFSRYNGINGTFGAKIQYVLRAAASQESGHLAFYTNEFTSAGTTLSEKLRLTSDGKLALGYTNPSYKFEVNGDISIGNDAAGLSNPKLVFNTTSYRWFNQGVAGGYKISQAGVGDALSFEPISLNATFESTVNSIGYLLNGINLFSSLSTNAIAKWDGTKFVDGSAGGATNLSYSTNTNTVTVISDTGTDAILPAATQSNAGILNTVDKTKIDNIWNTSVQSLSGTTVTMVWTSGINATITLTGTTTLTITDMSDGGESQIEVTNGSSSYSFNLNGSTGYTTEVIMGNNATINTTISSHTTVVIWRRGSTLYYGFIYNN